MRKFFIYHFLRLLAWYYDRLSLGPMGWVYYVLAKRAWQQGYYAACSDLRHRTVVSLNGAGRLALNSPYIRKPHLYSYESDFISCWDDGYKRAITLYRLNMDPSSMWRCRSPLAIPMHVQNLEYIVQTLIMGELKTYPGSYVSTDGGTDIVALTVKEAERYEYELYAGRRQQVVCAALSIATKADHAKAL
jgi:hypothetical protein